MKIGIEGTSEEIKGLFQNDGSTKDYFKKPEKPLSRTLFIVPSCSYIVSIILLTPVLGVPEGWHTFIFLIGCCCSSWLAVCLQIRFKNPFATSFIAIFGIAFMLVALGVLSPVELLDKAKNFKPK